MRLFLRFLLSEYARRPWQSMSILALTLITVGYPVVFSYSFVYLIDHVLAPEFGNELGWLLLALAAGGILAAAADFGAEYLLLRNGIRMQDMLRFKLMRHLQLLSESYYRNRQSSTVVGRMSGDLNNVYASYLALQPIANSVLGIGISAVLLLSMNGWLAGLLLVGFPCCFLLPKWIAPRAKTLSEEYKNRENFTGLIMDRVFYHQVIRAFNLRNWELGRLRRMTDDVAELGLRAQFARSALGKSVSSALLLLNVALVAGGILLQQRGMLTVGALVSFQSFYLRISGYLTSLTRLLPIFVQGSISHARLHTSILDQPLDPSERALSHRGEAIPPGEASGDRRWTIAKLSFGYTDDAETLSSVDMELPPGAYCAVVGSSGSGKSSLVGLLMRFHEPKSGAIRLGGRDVGGIPLDEYRSRIGFVPQEIVLFDATLRENIRFGRLDASDEEVEAAAKAAAIHDWILTLPSGYDTAAGERGSLLSGGERQRIALARALVRRPELLLLDEVTSMLDPGTEQEVNATLLSLKGSSTVVSVTHRLQTIVHADRIYVMERGRIAGWGTHDELLRASELYRSMWMKQSGIFVSDNGRNAVIEADRLRQIPLFQTLADAALEELRLAMWTENAEPGEDIVKQGDQGDTFYLVARGQVEVLLEGGEDEPKRVAVLEDGDFFGEMALLREVPRSSTVRSMTNCVFLVMDRRSFRKAVEADERMRDRLEAAYAKRSEELSKLR